MLRTLHHYAHAVETRLFLLYELSLLRRDGIRLEKDYYRKILKNPSNAEDWIHFVRFLQPSDDVLLLDLGANVGKFTADFLSIYRKGRAVLFEPVQSTFDGLTRRFVNDDRVQTHHCAISDFDGVAQINVEEESSLSSIATFTEEANRHFLTKTPKTEETPCRTLDSFDFPRTASKVFVKIDVQGLEIEVIRGGMKTLKMADMVMLECSFAEEWANKEPSFSPCCAMLRECGLYPVIFQDFGRALSNYAFERDVIFVRRELLENIWFENYGRKS